MNPIGKIAKEIGEEVAEKLSKKPVSVDSLVKKVRSNLSDDLRKPQYKNSNCDSSGHCYVASEAVYHILGGKNSGLKPMNIKHEGVSHWFLKDSKGNIIDPTKDQFKTIVPYEKAKGKGFLTKNPSKRAKKLINKIEGNNNG